jgi:hypothetical protein
LAALSAGAVLRPVSTARAVEVAGRVARAEGSLSAIRSAGIVGLAVGDAVFMDDILRTGEGARALIACDDGLQIAIGPGTEMALRSFVAEAGSVAVVLGLLQEITRLIGGVVAGGRTIEIDTRTAVASVRSTEWVVESTGRGTGVLAIIGEVTVRGLAGGTARPGPGEGTDVVPGGLPKAPARWGETRRRDAITRTNL